METKQCPWCAESIRVEARKCRYCGSRLEGALVGSREWHRGGDRKVAGVCASLAQNLNLPVTGVRAAFVLLGLFRGFGLFLYGVLWLVIPEEPGGQSVLDKMLAWGRGLLESPREGPRQRENDWDA